jgi:hypothetical protein
VFNSRQKGSRVQHFTRNSALALAAFTWLLVLQGSQGVKIMTLRILVAPSGFKESLGADEVADCIERGVLNMMPAAQVVKAPLVDGGEGFTKALVRATGGVLHKVKVMGPVGKAVKIPLWFPGWRRPEDRRA